MNGVDAERIYSGIVTDELIASWSIARGMEAADYMAGNLLKHEFEKPQGAKALLMLTQVKRTNGHVVTVDGGSVELILLKTCLEYDTFTQNVTSIGNIFTGAHHRIGTARPLVKLQP